MTIESIIVPTNIQKALEIFRDHHGILRSSEAQNLGIHPETINRMLERELITKEEKGLYKLAEKQIETDPDIINIAKLVPKAVFCLLTALSFHDMTREIPRRVYVALPFGYKAPDISHPPLEVVNLSQKPYEAGIENHILSGVTVPVYNEAKTVTDCFKFRRKIGESIAIEALKEYLKRDDHDIQLLLEYAKINRIKSRIEPYLRALV
jgi:predicted transcriptional regulator of viral defense system